MRTACLVFAALCLALAVPPAVRAGIVYDLQDYPRDQNGHTLSGSITTDGTTGTFKDATHIVSWTVTIDGTFTFRSSDINAQDGFRGLTATQTELTLAAPSDSSTNAVELEYYSLAGSGYQGIIWERTAVSQDYFFTDPDGSALWDNNSPSMGGTDPWVIAKAAAVPEPPTIIPAAIAVLTGLAYGWRRRKATA